MPNYRIPVLGWLQLKDLPLLNAKCNDYCTTVKNANIFHLMGVAAEIFEDMFGSAEWLFKSSSGSWELPFQCLAMKIWQLYC